jgi:hypothetical protein
MRHWTKHEDSLLETAYNSQESLISLSSKLQGRDIKSIYSRANKLGLKKVKADKILPINTANFDDKMRKRLLEKQTSGFILQKGGWFGIPGPAIITHYNTFKNILREHSPFIAVEENTMQYNKMQKEVENEKRIQLIKGELFDVLRSYTKITPRIPLFSYGHLDFCKTATTLIKKNNLLGDLVWLSQWEQLKTTFYLDISLSIRPDGPTMYNDLLQHTIPMIFRASGWEVSDVRKLKSPFILSYRDGKPMVNALYKFEK